MLDRYLAQVDAGEHFEADYARLGAQRNAKIVGIFAACGSATASRATSPSSRACGRRWSAT